MVCSVVIPRLTHLLLTQTYQGYIESGGDINKGGGGGGAGYSGGGPATDEGGGGAGMYAAAL